MQMPQKEAIAAVNRFLVADQPLGETLERVADSRGRRFLRWRLSP
jgi:hypothetical protein